MENCSNPQYIKIYDDHEIQTKTETSNDLENELNLFDNLQKEQTDIKEETDQKEENQLESEVDQQKLSEIQDDNNSSSDDDTTNIDQLTCDNQIFGDLLIKMKAYINESKKEKIDKNIFIDEYQIFKDFFNLIEKHEKNLTDEDLLVIRRGLKLFLCATDNIDPYDVPRTDLVYRKDIFYMYFNLINIPTIQNYLKKVQMADHLARLYHGAISRILIIIRAMSVYTDLGLNDHQRPSNSVQLLSLMLNYIRIDLESEDLSSSPSPDDVSIIRQYLLSIILTYADKTILIPDLIEAGCLEIILNGLTMICKTVDVDYDLQYQIIPIIYNISRHDDGIKQLNALNAIEVIEVFQSNNQYIRLNTMCCMILSLLSTPEQIKSDRKRMNNVLDTLLQMVYNASVSSDYHDDEGYHLSEMLIVFVKLFNDDRTLDYIMEHSQVDLPTSSPIEFFINQLIQYYDQTDNEDQFKEATCTALVNILWSISFQEKYKQKLKNADTKVKELITNFTKETNAKTSPNQYVPQYIENIQKAAKGFLFNIDESIDSSTKQVPGGLTGLNNNQKPMVMISYSHQDFDFCKQLYDKLLKQGYDIWIDFQFLKTGDLWEQIAAGMKRANVIVCLMSEEYCKSKSCRWEATYALEKLQATKSIIPVHLKKYQLPDWLEIRTAVLKYVRFHDVKQLEDEKLFELIDMIEHSLSTTISKTNLNLHPSVLPVHHEPASIPLAKDNKPTLHSSNILPVHHDQLAQTKPSITKLENENISSKSNLVRSATTTESLYPQKPIEEWNKNDISQWFEYNQILTELQQLCQFEDGHELLNYAKIFLDTEKSQYQMYSNEFLRRDGITYGQRPLLLHQFTKFSNALRKLEKFNKLT